MNLWLSWGKVGGVRKRANDCPWVWGSFWWRWKCFRTDPGGGGTTLWVDGWLARCASVLISCSDNSREGPGPALRHVLAWGAHPTLYLAQSLSQLFQLTACQLLLGWVMPVTGHRTVGFRENIFVFCMVRALWTTFTGTLDKVPQKLMHRVPFLWSVLIFQKSLRPRSHEDISGVSPPGDI